MKYYYLKRYHGIFYYKQQNQRKYGYRYNYYDSRHHRHEKSSRGYTDIRQAVVALARTKKQYHELSSSHYVTFQQWCNSFLNRIKLSKKVTTYENYYHLLEHNVVPYLGKRLLVNIKPMYYKYHCLMALLQQGLSHKTVVDINNRVQTVMNDAVRNGYLKRNQFKGVQIPNVNQRPKKQIMNSWQLKKFNRCLDRHSIQFKAIFYTLEYTGMRIGELLGLHWKDVDLDRQELRIRYTRDGYGLRSPKTKHSQRTVPISKFLKYVLAKYYHCCKSKFGIKSSDLVIRGKHGRPLIPNVISIVLKKLLVESGLKKMTGRFTPHSFRHMLVSRLIDAGIRPIAVSRMMGHASVAITLNVYAQSAPGEMLNIDKALKEIK